MILPEVLLGIFVLAPVKESVVVEVVLGRLGPGPGARSIAALFKRGACMVS